MNNFKSSSAMVWQELIVGGQKSGKTRRAEQTAHTWMLGHAQREAVYVATGQAWDAEMQMRIARHQSDRQVRVPGMRTVEAPLHLAQALLALSTPHTLLVVDCLTLWLTNWMMPMEGASAPSDVDQNTAWQNERQAFLDVLPKCPGPIVVVSNEIGWGVIPMGREVRAFVDALGALNQDVARVCSRATLMAAGLPVTLK